MDKTNPVVADADWPHEASAIQLLKASGRSVTRIPRSREPGERTADIVVDGEIYEMKSPTASSTRALERNVRRALHQAQRVVIDGRRMSKMSNQKLEHELTKMAGQIRSLRALLLITHDGRVIDIPCHRK